MATNGMVKAQPRWQWNGEAGKDQRNFKEKMNKAYFLTGFESCTRNVSPHLIPRFLACGLGVPKYKKNIVRNEKVRK